MKSENTPESKADGTDPAVVCNDWLASDLNFNENLNASISFHGKNNKEVGRLRFDNDKLTFTGNADEAAEMFVKSVGNALSQKLQDYEAALMTYRNTVSKDGRTPARDALAKWSFSG